MSTGMDMFKAQDVINPRHSHVCLLGFPYHWAVFMLIHLVKCQAVWSFPEVLSCTDTNTDSSCHMIPASIIISDWGCFWPLLNNSNATCRHTSLGEQENRSDYKEIMSSMWTLHGLFIMSCGNSVLDLLQIGKGTTGCEHHSHKNKY